MFGFRITGWLDGSQVDAVYEDGVLTAHPAMVARAELAARVDEVFRESTSCDGVAGSFLVLVRSLDRLISARFDLKSTMPARPALPAGG